MQKLKNLLLKPIFKFRVNYGIFNPLRWNWGRVKEFLKIFLLVVASIAMVLIIIDFMRYDTESENEEMAADISDRVIEYFDEGSSDGWGDEGDCNASGIELHGALLTYIPPESYDADGNILEDYVASENIVYAINSAEKDDSVKAIILEIDSYGGSAVAAEEISSALKNAKKPTAALIREGGASAAYFAATGADRIFASENSDIGSIGVTMSYLDNTKYNEKEGMNYNQLSSGKFKDMGDPDKPLSLEEKNLLMRDVNIVYENFIKTVSENRNLDIEKVRALADGSTMLGAMALQNGLIDQIGGMPEVKEYLKEKIGEDVEICW